MMTVQILMSLAGASPMMITAKFSGKTFVSKEMFSGHFLSASRHHSPIVVINIDPHKDGKLSLSKNLLVFHLLSFPRHDAKGKVVRRVARIAKKIFRFIGFTRPELIHNSLEYLLFSIFQSLFHLFLYLIQLEISLALIPPLECNLLSIHYSGRKNQGT